MGFWKIIFLVWYVSFLFPAGTLLAAALGWETVLAWLLLNVGSLYAIHPAKRHQAREAFDSKLGAEERRAALEWYVKEVKRANVENTTTAAATEDS